MNWYETLLGELISIKHGWAFKGEHFSDSGEYILLTPGNCHERGGLRLKGDKEKYYRGDFPDAYLLKQGDLIVVMTDLVNSAPILGGSFLIPEDNRFLHNQRLGLVQIKDESRIDKGFLYHLLNTHGYRSQVRGSATGATVKHTAPERIYRCKVRIPRDVDEQRRIADVLNCYDDKELNNRQRIGLLEESARELYKEWFVRLRFPGYEKAKIVNGVPEGWTKKRMEEICESVGGGTPSTTNSSYWEGGDITWVIPSDITKNDCLVLLAGC